MKKWLLTCLFVLLATLLCTACAEDEREHKCHWKKADFTNHVKFCEICGIPDRTSTAKQDETYAWPDEPPKDSDGNPEQVLTGPIKCSVCGWGFSQSFSAETSDIHASTCTRCGDHYSDGKIAKLGHWFGERAPEADDAQRALCLRDGCGHTALVECTRFNYALKVEGDEIPYVFSLCPICGRVRDELRLERVENAMAQAVNGRSVLPDGELTVRMGALENGERGMSVVFELSGQPTQPDGEIQISLPAEVLTGSTLALLDEDSVETPLDFTVNDETATFTLNFTDAGTPMALIRLIPAE